MYTLKKTVLSASNCSSQRLHSTPPQLPGLQKLKEGWTFLSQSQGVGRNSGRGLGEGEENVNKEP